MGNKSYQLTSAGQSANHGQPDWHWLAGNSYFLCQRIFILSFSEPLGINMEGLNSLLLGIQLLIQIHFDGLCGANWGSSIVKKRQFLAAFSRNGTPNTSFSVKF